MAVPTLRSAFLSCLFSIVLLSPALKIQCDSTCGLLPVAFAEAATRNILARGNVRSESHSVNDSAKNSHASGTIASDGDSKLRNSDSNSNSNSRSLDESGEDNNHSSYTSSSLSLCLRPLTIRSGLYLKTLYRQYEWEEENESVDNQKKNFSNFGSFDFCWKPFRDDESKLQIDSMTFTSKPMSNNAVAPIVSRIPKVRLSSNSKNNRTVGQESVALKVDLLFATLKVQNNEIPLPRSIAELLRHEKATLDSTLHDDSPEALTQSRLPTNIKLSSRAAARVDLTGRWRPAKTISTQDLTDYDEFLKACCSDKISYWTRQVLSSSSVVSRQEFVVKQFDEGRILEFVDIHPLASNVWNRTIVTSTSPEKNRLAKNSSALPRDDDSKLDGHRSYVNELKGLQGDPVLIEAYWEDNGTVLTSLLRTKADDSGDDGSDNQGWLQTRRYLFPDTDHFESQQNEENKNRVMVVETTFHSTLYPTETEALLIARNEEDTLSTKMVWRWEQVDESSG